MTRAVVNFQSSRDYLHRAASVLSKRALLAMKRGDKAQAKRLQAMSNDLFREAER
jgi:hypothetical protein